MSHKEYYYNETVTRFYDAVYDSMKNLVPGREFYLDEIKKTDGAVLEAGAGTGRIFIPALTAGADIYGIDYSEMMLQRLKGKIPSDEHYRLFNGDIRNFLLEKKFKLVISPFRVFQHLVTVDDQLKALDSLYNHLEEGGRLVFDVFNPDLTRINKNVDEMPEFEGEYAPGKKLRRLTSIKFDHINQIMDLTFKFVWDENGMEMSDSFTTPLRYYFRFELENLIGRTKFKLENIYGDFKHSALSNNSHEFVVVCRK
jgi:SAM-dependent methyltransferase